MNIYEIPCLGKEKKLEQIDGEYVGKFRSYIFVGKVEGLYELNEKKFLKVDGYTVGDNQFGTDKVKRLWLKDDENIYIGERVIVIKRRDEVVAELKRRR